MARPRPQRPAPAGVIPSRYGGADGLDLLRDLAAAAPTYLVPGGRIYALVTAVMIGFVF